MFSNTLIRTKPEFSDAVKAFFFENKTRKCMIYGHSMEPFLSFGETVEIRPRAGPLKKGHCYAFITGSTLTIHRFIKNSGKNHALFAGDSSLFFDRVPLPKVVGELSPCQKHRALFIINIINSVFCLLMQVFDKTIVIHRFRRCMIRSLIGSATLKG